MTNGYFWNHRRQEAMDLNNIQAIGDRQMDER